MSGIGRNPCSTTWHHKPLPGVSFPLLARARLLWLISPRKGRSLRFKAGHPFNTKMALAPRNQWLPPVQEAKHPTVWHKASLKNQRSAATEFHTFQSSLLTPSFYETHTGSKPFRGPACASAGASLAASIQTSSMRGCGAVGWDLPHAIKRSFSLDDHWGEPPNS